MYSTINDLIYATLATLPFGATKVVPSNYKGSLGGEHIKVSILYGRDALIAHGYSKQQNGMLILSLFVKFDKGDKELARLADIANSTFQYKTLGDSLQFGISSLEPVGEDTADPSLYHGIYKINFNFTEK